MSTTQFEARNWFDIWNLKCANCASNNPIAKPLLNDEGKRTSKDYWQVTVDGVKSDRIEQEWGEPKQDLTVISKPIVVAGEAFSSGIGTHARSKIEFTIPEGKTHFKTLIGVPDQESNELTEKSVGSVVFEIRADSKILYTSKVIRSGRKAVSVTVPISGGQKLELFAYDAGDGNQKDHVCWIEPMFVSEPVLLPPT